MGINQSKAAQQVARVSFGEHGVGNVQPRLGRGFVY